MKIIASNYKKVNNEEPLTITMGNFDGLHLGHQRLIERVLTYSDTKHAILTFDPHPSAVLRKNIFRTLTQKNDKIELFSRFALDYTLIIDFDLSFSYLSLDEFIAFLKKISVKRLVIGRDTRFSYRGIGTISDLKKYFIVDVVSDILYNNMRISTTYIKDFLSFGEIETASKLLNRNYTIKGIVVHGNSIGTKLGFPTANVEYGEYYLPKSGVYYVRVLYQDVWYHGMANIGNNPTLNFSLHKRFEIHILDFSKQIYGKKLEIVFFKYLREELKFRGREQLIGQLKIDEIAVRKLYK